MISHLSLPFELYLPFFQVSFSEISTYSLFIVAAFIAARQDAVLELHFRRLPPFLADRISSISLLAGLAGGRLLFLYEVRDLLEDHGPYHWFAVLTGTGGFVFYGGFLFAGFFTWLYLKVKSLPILQVGDAIAPAIALGYGIGRLGCWVSGDGCFGFQSPWEIPFFTFTPGPGALVSTQGVRVFNTPLMEAFASLGFYSVFRRRIHPPAHRAGTTLSLFLLWNGMIRILVEFLRTNEPLFGLLPPPTFTDRTGLTWILDPVRIGNDGVSVADFYRNWYWNGPTLSQLIGFLLVATGLFFFWLYSRKEKRMVSN